jgi:hypothetical protein
MGQSPPKTHLSDPHKVFRQLKLLHFGFPLFAKKAHQVDAKNPEFQNTPI